MSTLYVVLAVIIGVIVATTTFVVVGAIERHKKVNINWVLLMLVVILSCSLAMVVIYHSENDLTLEDTKEAYDNGFSAGVESTQHTYPSNEEVEEWMASTKEVIISTHKDGSDPAIHIIDSNGEEWVLIADEVNQNG